MTTPYGNAPTGPAGPTAQSTTSVLSIISFVLSGISLFLFPIIFGAAAIVTGAVALGRKERLGKIALIVAIAATVIGMVLGAIVYSQAT